MMWQASAINFDLVAYLFDSILFSASAHLVQSISNYRSTGNELSFVLSAESLELCWKHIDWSGGKRKQ